MCLDSDFEVEPPATAGPSLPDQTSPRKRPRVTSCQGPAKRKRKICRSSQPLDFSEFCSYRGDTLSAASQAQSASSPPEAGEQDKETGICI